MVYINNNNNTLYEYRAFHGLIVALQNKVKQNTKQNINVCIYIFPLFLCLCSKFSVFWHYFAIVLFTYCLQHRRCVCVPNKEEICSPEELNLILSDQAQISWWCNYCCVISKVDREYEPICTVKLLSPTISLAEWDTVYYCWIFSFLFCPRCPLHSWSIASLLSRSH